MESRAGRSTKGMGKKLLPIQTVSLVFLLLTVSCGPSKYVHRRSPVKTDTPPIPQQPPITTIQPQTGEDFFNSTVVPAVEKRCEVCHINPHGGAVSPAPLSIYDYEDMKNWLSTGRSAQQNVLVDKIQSIVSHGGGNRCPDLNDSPCREIQEWWQIELGDTHSAKKL